jgi:RNA polymerase sigma-70 factor (ECF subfamily)
MAEQLKKINPIYIDAITLKYYYGYSNDEIAELLNISEGNIRVRLHRAKQALKEILQEGDFEIEGEN